MRQIFATLGTIYGHLWRSQFKSKDAAVVAQAVWFRAFEDAGLTADDILRTLNHCKLQEPQMPNLPTFIGLCRSGKALSACHRPYRGLLPPKGTWAERQARGQSEIAKLKGLLGD